MTTDAADRIAHEWGAVTAALSALVATTDATDAADGAHGADAAWELPTRLPGWSVADLARHIHWGVTLEADGLGLVGTDGTRRAHGREHAGPAADLPDAVRAAVETLVQRARALPDDAAAVVPMPYGDVPLAVALDVFVMEAAVHRSDLAHALAAAGHPAAGLAGPGDELTPATVASTAAFLQGWWDVLATGAPRPPAGTSIRLEGTSTAVTSRFAAGAWAPFDGPATTTVRGDDSAVLLFALGRIPLDDARLSVVGEGQHAARLKEYLPGP